MLNYLATCPGFILYSSQLEEMESGGGLSFLVRFRLLSGSTIIWAMPTTFTHCELGGWRIEVGSEPWLKCPRLLLNFNRFSCIHVSSFIVYP